MKKKKHSPSVQVISCVALFLFSPGCNQRQHVQHPAAHAHQAFSGPEAIDQMAKNFESAERDAMQQPQKVLQFMGNIKGKKIMDIGAGTGYFSVKFARAGATVIAADVSDVFQEFLKNRIAQENPGHIELKKIPYDNPLLEDKTVDIVFMANTCHHIENRTQYFSKVYKGIKPGGELVIVDFFKVEFEEKVQAPVIQMRASVDDVVFELKKAGFTSFETDVNSLAYQYLIKAKKP